MSSFEGFRLSPQQKRLWALGPALGTASVQVRIQGPLAIETLRQALRAVVGRHEILRTAFHRLPDTRFPLQVIGEAAEFHFHQSENPEDATDGFPPASSLDFAKGPLLEAILVSRGDRLHSLRLSLPALCADALSLKLIVAELADRYAELAGCRGCQPGQDPVQYADAAEVLIDLLESEETRAMRAYWSKQDLRAIHECDLPFGKRHGETETFHRARHSVEDLPRQLAERDDAEALLACCWQLLLWRQNRMRPAVTGHAVSGRTFEDLAGALGPFSKYVPVAASLREEMSFPEALAAYAKALEKARAYQDFFDWPASARAGAETAFFPFVFDFIEETPPSHAGDTEFTLDSLHCVFDRFRLRLACTGSGERLALSIDYDAALFDESEIQLVAAQLSALVREAITRPGTAIAELSLWNGLDRERLAAFNDSDMPVPDRSVVDLFEAAVAEAPGKTALSRDGRTVDYRTLSQRANRLARALRSRGVGPETLVGIHCPRSVEMVTGILAVLKAGAAFLPLDPGYPRERLAYIAADSGIRWALVNGNDREGGFGEGVACLEMEALASEPHEPENLGCAIDPDHMAYAIYTSGSTGKPKGAVIAHRGLANYLVWARAHFLGRNMGSVPLHSPMGFDLTVTSLFLPLISGRCLEMVREASGPDAVTALGEAWQRGGHAFVKLTPSHLEALRHELPSEPSNAGPAALVVGGEALSWETLRFWRERAPRTRIFNEYGPTETTVACCCYRLGSKPGEGPVPIGRPAANSRLYPLDFRLTPVATGIPGELFVGGPGVCRGYWQRPGLTAERFLPDPFEPLPGQRMYRTGDLVRMLGNGNLSFLGRTDHQVKLRGFRVELGEIEAALAAHPEVDEAAVVAWQARDRAPSLTAFYVPVAPATEIRPEALRAFLEKQLPEYMVPGGFAALEALPLNPHGKVDRAALLERAVALDAETLTATAYAAPRTPAERCLAGIWAGLLGRERVGIHDNFFALGGDSILSIQIVARARRSGLHITAQQLFDYQTVADLAAVAQQVPDEPTLAMPGSAMSFPSGMDAETRERVLAAENPVTAVYALSPLQQGILFHALFDRESEAYFEQLHCRLLGRLDVTAFETAWQTVAARHDALRTSFYWRDIEKPLQRVHAEITLPWVLEDWRGRSQAERNAGLRAFLEKDRRAGFDMERAPLMRCALLQFGDEEYIFVWSHHHAILDGWSLTQVLADVFTAYDRVSTGERVPWTEPPPYRGFIAWLERQDRERAAAYWRECLAPFRTPTRLPEDPGAGGEGARHGVRTLFLSESQTSALETWARDRRLTVNTLVQGAWSLLLSRYTGESKVLFGVTVSGRPPELEDVEAMVGLFINTLPAGVRVPGNSESVSWLQGLQAEQVTRETHAFSALAEIQALSPIPAGTPLFDSILIFENYPVDAAMAAEERPVRIGDVRRFERTNVPLTVIAVPEERLSLEIAFDRKLFHATTVDRMLLHFRTILTALVSPAPTRLAAIGHESMWERAQTLIEWNDRAAPYPEGSTVHALFENRVSAMPDGTALVFETAHLSYRALDSRANRLAERLRSRGVVPETPVAIRARRGPEMIVGLLGTLKAGGAYLPLDPAYPEARQSLILADSATSFMLTQRALAGVDGAAGGHYLFLDDTATGSELPPRGAGVTRENLSHIIYTSGSTGRPKGVAIRHRNVSALLAWSGTLFPRAALQGVLASTSICFDLSVFEIFVPLGHGGTVVLAENALQLPALAARDRVVLINTVPSAIAELVKAGSVPRSVRTVNLAGEPLRRDLVAALYALDHVRAVYNLYGPSEDTTYSTYARVPRTASEAPLIGRPVNGTGSFLLDSLLRPVPLAAAGELCLGGRGLARGYHRAPERTAEKFVPHPFSQRPGSRLYRTGDLASYRASGEIAFLGRFDHQVKLRGFRIELGEVETYLCAHPSVREAAAMVREDLPGDRKLVGYLVLKDEGQGAAVAATAGEWEPLRAFLREKLPDHMVPARFVALKALPMTPNGKVDRKALPAPDRALAAAPYAAPRNRVERVFARIWSQTFGIERVGIHDNFFDLGGDSIISFRIVAKTQQAGWALTHRQLFEQQTIAELAPLAVPVTAPKTPAGPVTGPMPLTPVQQWFFEDERRDPHHYNQALMFTVPGEVSPAHLERAVAAILRHHDALRLRFRHENGSWHQTNAAADEGTGENRIPFEVRDLGTLAKETRSQVLNREADKVQSSLDLESGPLARFLLFRFHEEAPDGPPGCRLLIAIHHLAIDGVSWRILLEDLETAFRQYAADEPLSLPAKTTPYKEWAERLADCAGGETVTRESAFWLSLSASHTALPLDAPFSPESNTSADTDSLTTALAPDLTRDLLRRVPQAYNTRINDVLLSALLLALTRWTGSRTARVDLEGHGREALFDRVDLSRTVGWFTSIYPVVLHLPNRTDSGSLLKSVKEQLRQIPNRGVGYGILRYLNPEIGSKLRALPKSEILFNYLGQVDRVLAESAMLGPAPEPCGETVSPRAARRHLLEIGAIVQEGKLYVHWTYGKRLHQRETVASLANSFTETLTGLIRHCLEPEAKGFTPSDFPLARIGQTALDRLTGELTDLEDLYLLSPMQQGMFFHSLYAEDRDPYLSQLACTLAGPLDTGLFKRAWEWVAARHPILRTSFHWRELPETLQAVHRGINLPWTEVDWRGLAPEIQRERCQAYLRERRGKGMTMDRAPLFDLALFRLEEKRWRFVWTHHHTLLDGWSLGTIFKELFTFYHGNTAGESQALAAPPPYRAYIDWLRRQDREAAERFWRETLRGFVPLPSLGFPGCPADSGHAADSLPIHRESMLFCSTALTERLTATARRYRLTLNTLVQGAWAITLSRHTGEPDPVFGVTVAGRPETLPRSGEMVGLFINTLPLCTRLEPTNTAVAMLRAIQNRQAECEAFAYTSLADIRKWSGLPGGTPLFESVLIFENFPVDASLGAGARQVAVEDVVTFEETNFPLTLVAVPGERLRLVLSYESQRFPATAAAGLLRQFRELLAAIAERPEQPLAALPAHSEPERHRLLVEWNDTAFPVPGPNTAHRLFEEMAGHAPDRTAVLLNERQLTYGALLVRAVRLAARMRGLGIDGESVVGLCMEPVPDAIAGLLAIPMAGGVYLPLNPGDPADRLAMVLADSGTSLLLSASSDRKKLSGTGVPILCPEETGETPLHPNAVSNRSDLLAYVIYTSGSTGKPKGVMVSHESLANQIAWRRVAFGMDARDTLLQTIALSFDPSVWQILWPLSSGGRLVLLAAGERKDAARLVALMACQRVTVTAMVPSLLRVLLDEPGFREQSQLRHISCGGEPLTPDLQRRFLAETGLSKVLHVVYGPTEATIDASSMPAEAAGHPQPVPIGRPITNSRLYTLDTHSHPVPAGVRGEIHIGGVGLARGYLRRPALTASRFVPDPLSAKPGSRLYKSGDLGAHDATGRLVFLGRVDRQIKVRGFRVEPGEIEAVLDRCPGVRQAAVIVTEEAPGRKRLVAFVAGDSLDSGAVRAYLERRLPEHMMPAALTAMDALPRTPGGKVDRMALRKVAPRVFSSLESFVPPSTAAEKALADIWQSLLSVQRVGIHDNFFELGGDSIVTIQVIARARQAGLELTPKQLFENPTVGALAPLAGQAERVTAEQGPVTGTLPLTPIQHWFFERNLGNPHHFNQAILLEIPGTWLPDRLRTVLVALYEHHDALRLRFTAADGEWRQEITTPDSPPRLAVHDLSGLADPARSDALAARATEVQTSLNLTDGPLFGAALFPGFGTDDRPTSRLLLAIHHLAVDGVSWRILLEDLTSAYRQLSRGETLSLPPKTTSFKEWAQRLAAHARSGPLDAAEKYWSDERFLHAGPLPVDLNAGENTLVSAEVVATDLEETETLALLREAGRAYNTRIEDLLLTALARTLADWTGDRAVQVDLEGHGRERIFDDVDLTRTVGWFTAIYPAVLTLPNRDEPGETGWGEHLKSIKEQLRGVPGRGLGYGLLRYLRENGETETGHSRIQAEIAFNYLGRVDPVPAGNEVLKPASEPRGPQTCEEGTRPYLMEINGLVANEKLRIDWTFSRNRHRRETVEGLANAYMDHLTDLIRHCLEPESWGRTPSDFPLAGLSRTALDRVLGEDRGIEDLYPLSPLQEGMLFHRLYEPESMAYFQQLDCTLSGNMDLSAFRNAWDTVVHRHPSLRISLRWKNLERPLQAVHQRVSPEWLREDLTQQADPSSFVASFLERDRAKGFDLDHPPLMRFALFQMAENQYRFVWSHSHLLLDGWSLATVLREVMEAYESLRKNRRPSFPAAAPFKRYIAWLEDRDRDSAAAYWRKTLEGMTAPTIPAVDRAAIAAVKSEPAARHSQQVRDLPAVLCAALTHLARRLRITSNSLAQGAWALLLSRYSGEEKVVFGATVAGRPPELPGIQSMVGLFINTLPVRIAAAPNSKVVDWLRQLHAQQAAQQEFAYSPLVSIHGWCGIPHDQPLFENMLAFENYPPDAAVAERESSLEVRSAMGLEQTDYPLTAVVIPGRSWTVSLMYDPGRYQDEDLARLLAHFEHLLAEFAANPERRLGTVPILSGEEQRRVLVEWNRTGTVEVEGQTIQGLVAAQVARIPDAPAVLHQSHGVHRGSVRFLTYGALDLRARLLANRLRGLGSGPEVAVGICVGRSPEMIAGMLAILRSGGAYVPMDPAYPDERLTRTLDDAGIGILVTETALSSRFRERNLSQVTVDETGIEDTETGSEPRALPENLSHVIYTSGSTGRPKGVAIRQGAVVALFDWMKRSFSAEELRCVLAGTSICFDLSVFEILGTLSMGGRMLLAENALALPRLAPRHEVTLINTVPSAMRELLHLNGVPASVRVVNLAGEALPADLVREVYGLGTVRRVLNLYGPSEDTTYSTGAVMARGVDMPTIGRPLLATRAYILDRNLEPAPVAVPGELCLGGRGTARGYLGYPSRTAAQFVPDPFHDEPGTRLYRSGDVARFLADGDIAFLGRVDHQVKLRGFRVELGEIETLLSHHPAIGQAAVLMRQEPGRAAQLVAYAVSERDPHPEPEELAAFLKTRVPEHLVPATFVFVESLPLTPNGKLDRRALARLAANRQTEPARREYAPPETEGQEILAEIWRDALGVPRIGINDHFFELGGHSLLVNRVVTRLWERLDIELPIKALFEYPVLADLAEYIEVTRWAAHSAASLRDEEVFEEEGIL